MKKSKKIKLIIITVIVLGLAGYITYMCLHYFFYNGYKKYLTKDNTFEKGNEFKELTDSDPKVNGMVLAAENDILKLYTNTKTTEIAVYDKRSGEITYSNPVDRDSDPLANGRNKVDLNSQFMLTYYDTGKTQITMYNYDYSVARKQYKMESIKDGIRFTYLCGNMESPTGLIPPYITQDRLQEKILSKLSRREASLILNSYVESEKVKGFLELTSGAQSSKIGMEKMEKLVEKAGYTQEDFNKDSAAASGGKLPEQTSFTIVLEYRLVDDKLVVTVPTDKIKETGSGKLGNIDLLSYFGAGTSKEEGYIFVPNGSGSLINFNNGKKSERYNQYVYGMDETSQGYTVVDKTETTRMPIYGIKHAKSAVLAQITEGDTLANIIADVAGKTNSYNYVYPSFELRGSLKVSLLGVEGVSADLPTLEKNIYDTDLTVTYSFLEKKDASYSGMADYYRNELIKRGELAQKKTENNIPFYLDILGGVKMEKSVLAVPYLGVYPMTTFDEAGIITDSFKDNKVSNLRVNYLGWFNGGYYHDTPKTVKVERKLGGKKDLKKLNQKLTRDGIRLFGDVAFQKVTWEADHYNYKIESAMRYTGYPAVYGLVNPAILRKSNSLGYEENMYDILSPKYLGRYVGKFLGSFHKTGLSGVSLRDLGDVISSDKRRTNIINREEAKQIIKAQLKRLDTSTDYLMINAPNSYSWAYATDLTNVPLKDNPYYIVDEEVPFYQMVIHGSIDYTSGAINLSDSYNEQETVLRLIESGAAPHFTLSYQDSSEMKYSALNVMYSTQYKTWLKDAADIYQKTNSVLKYVVNSKIINHEILEDGVKKITYDNGAVIYINSNKKEVAAGNVKIPAMGYVMEGVKE